MLGIKSYNPQFYTALSQIIKDQKIRLQGLKGKKIKGIWVAWEEISDEWFSDLPVIIRFEDCQLELCAYKSGEYAITFDQIDLSEEIHQPFIIKVILFLFLILKGILESMKELAGFLFEDYYLG